MICVETTANLRQRYFVPDFRIICFYDNKKVTPALHELRFRHRLTPGREFSGKDELRSERYWAGIFEIDPTINRNLDFEVNPSTPRR
jgi:hypothetical protein